MALQPFNVQALQDPGLGVAASLLGSGIANFSEGLRTRDNNRAAYARQMLISKTAEEEARLKAEADAAVAQAGTPKKLFDLTKVMLDVQKAGREQGTNPEIVDAITAAAESAQAQALLGSQGASQAAASAPQRGLASRLLGSDVVDLGKAVGGGVKKLFDRDEEVATPQQMPSSELLDGATPPVEQPRPKFAVSAEKEQEPYISRYDESPAGKQLRAETEKKILEAKEKNLVVREKELTNLPDDFLYGKGVRSGQEMVDKLSRGEAVENVDKSGFKFEHPMTPGVVEWRSTFYGPAFSGEQRAKSSAATMDLASNLPSFSRASSDLIGMYDDSRGGRLQATLTTLPVVGTVYKLVAPPNSDPRYIKAVNYFNNVYLQAVRLNKALGNSGNQNFNEIQAAIESIGSPATSKELLVENIAKLESSMFDSALKGGLVLGGPTYNRLHSAYKEATGGQTYLLDDPEIQMKTQDAIRNNLVLAGSVAENIGYPEVSTPKSLPVAKPQPSSPLLKSKASSVNKDDLVRITAAQVAKMSPLELSQVDIKNLYDQKARSIYAARLKQAAGGAVGN